MSTIRDYDELGGRFRGRELLLVSVGGNRYFANRNWFSFSAYQIDSENEARTEAKISRVKDEELLRKIREVYENEYDRLIEQQVESEDFGFS